MTDTYGAGQAWPTTGGGRLALEGWRSVRQMIDDLTRSVEEESETELELLEGLRVLARATALCSELSLDVDTDAPWFFSMNTPARYIGGPAPDGEYFLAMIDGRHRYRVRGLRGTSAYLGFQVLAGVGLTPRRMAAYISDRDLALADDGGFAFVLAAHEPTQAELGGDQWIAIPDDASGIVVREYIADRAHEAVAELAIEPLDTPAAPAPPDDALPGRTADRHGLDDRQADHPAPDHPTGAAGDAQPVDRGRGGRARGGGHHTRQPLHDGHLPSRSGRGPAPRHRAT